MVVDVPKGVADEERGTAVSAAARDRLRTGVPWDTGRERGTVTHNPLISEFVASDHWRRVRGR